MLTVNQIEIAFAGLELFRDVTFQASPGERIALAGKNGAGKSTLLRIIAGLQKADAGQIETPSEYTIGFLQQDLNNPSNLSVREEAKKAFAQINALKDEVEEIHKKLLTFTTYDSPEYMDLLDDLSEKETRLGLLGVEQLDQQCETVLRGLGFTDESLEKPVSKLSGGWKMRVELAKILLEKPDLILLDEPTNHLDIESILWLEGFLQQADSTLLLISHDKAFLDAVTTRTLELANGKVEDYRCNYSKYLVEREERIERQLRAKKNQEEELKQLDKNIERFRAKANKAKFAQSLIKKRDKIERIEVDSLDETNLSFRFAEPNRSGKEVVKVNDVSKSFKDLTVFSDVSLTILRGEKVAFVGKNGAGKTTLSRIIAGVIDADSGSVDIGYNVLAGFYAQEQADALDGSLTVLETIDRLATGRMRTRVRALLGAFLFSGEDVKKKVSVLSGGERARLALSKLLLRPYNLLILDEPTNHLDIRAKEVLKQAIEQYEGTVIVVSHDRDFLDGLTEKVFEFSGGSVNEHLGDVNAFLSMREAESFRAFEQNPKATPEKSKESAKNSDDYKLRKDLKRVESKIDKLEKTIAKNEAKLKDPEEFKKLANDSTFFENYEKTKEDLAESLAKWEKLADKLDS